MITLQCPIGTHLADNLSPSLLNVNTVPPLVVVTLQIVLDTMSLEQYLSDVGRMDAPTPHTCCWATRVRVSLALHAHATKSSPLMSNSELLPFFGRCKWTYDHRKELSREWGDGIEDGLQHARFHLVVSIQRSEGETGLECHHGRRPCYDRTHRSQSCEDVTSILEDAGLLAFFQKILGFSEDITSQIVDSWTDGKVTVNGLEFSINEVLIAEVSGLPNEGEVITRDKTNQVGQLTKFITDDETFCWLESGIAKESLPKPWDRVAMQVMKYLTLEGKFHKLFRYHIAIVNSMRNKKNVNIPLFLLKSMEKFVRAVKAGKGKAPLHQGLMKLLVDFEKDRRGVVASPSKGGFSRLSDGDPSVTVSKDGGSRKRKPPSKVLNASMSKYSSEEDHTVSEIGKLGEGGNSLKVVDADPIEKGPTKGLDGIQTLIKELRCHLYVLNGLEGSLSSACACINLLTLEITNYLKEVVKNMKDLSAAKE
eukprot:Gb_21171 [translate_table: standard]